MAANLDTPPTAPANPGVSGGSATWTTGSRTITASAATVGGVFNGQSDAINHYEYRTLSNGSVGAITTGSSDTITSRGTTFIQFRAVDTYGNVSTWYPTKADPAGEARIDATAPNPPSVSGGVANAVSGTLTVSAVGGSDPGDSSGLAVDTNGRPIYHYRTSINNGSTWSSAQTATDGQVAINTAGTTLVQFQTVDNAGNVSTWAGPSSYSGSGDASNHVTISTGATTGTDACNFFKNASNQPGHITAAYESGDGKVHLTEGAPWIVNSCTLTSDTGVPVVVDPGAELQFGAGYGLTINGTFTVGSATDTRAVVFESTARAGGSGAPGTWAGVILIDPSNNSAINNAVFTDGGNGFGTVPTLDVQNSGAVTIDHSKFARNKTDYTSSTKPGAVEVETIPPDTTPGSLTITHSQISENSGIGAKSVDATLALDNNDVVHHNDGYGVYLTTSGSLTGVNPGTVNHSEVSNNGETGVYVFDAGSATSLAVTASSGSHNNITDNGAGGAGTACAPNNINGCQPGEIRVDIPSTISDKPGTLDTFDFRNNYLGVNPFQNFCIANAAAPGGIPNDPLFGIPYQMENGYTILLDIAFDKLNEVASGGQPYVGYVLSLIENQSRSQINSLLGINDWTAMTFSDSVSPIGFPNDLQTPNQGLNGYCYFDYIPTAPTSDSPVDNSGL